MHIYIWYLVLYSLLTINIALDPLPDHKVLRNKNHIYSQNKVGLYGP